MRSLRVPLDQRGIVWCHRARSGDHRRFFGTQERPVSAFAAPNGSRRALNLPRDRPFASFVSLRPSRTTVSMSRSVSRAPDTPLSEPSPGLPVAGRQKQRWGEPC